MKPQPSADAALLAHMRDCIARIAEYTAFDRRRFESSRLVQDAVVRNLQTLTESSQRLSDGAKAAEPGIPWRELAGFRNVLVHGYLGVDLQAVWAGRRAGAAVAGCRPGAHGKPMNRYLLDRTVQTSRGDLRPGCCA